MFVSGVMFSIVIIQIAFSASRASPAVGVAPLADEKQITKSVVIADVGRAAHLCTGDIWVVYNDQSQILVQSSTTTVVYVSPDGRREK